MSWAIWIFRHSGLRDGGRFNLLIMGVVYLTFGFSMHLQPMRWVRTPAYHDLFAVLPEAWWGTIYLICGTALLTAILLSRHYWIVLGAVTLGLMVSISWSFAFVVRVVTSSSTTPETFMSFLAFSYLLFRVLWLMEHGRKRLGTPT